MLRDHGHFAEHVNDIGPGDASDRTLIRYASDHDAVIVTKDEDFSSMFAVGVDMPPVVWVRVGNTRRGGQPTYRTPLTSRGRLATARTPWLRRTRT